MLLRFLLLVSPPDWYPAPFPFTKSHRQMSTPSRNARLSGGGLKPRMQQPDLEPHRVSSIRGFVEGDRLLAWRLAVWPVPSRLAIKVVDPQPGRRHQFLGSASRTPCRSGLGTFRSREARLVLLAEGIVPCMRTCGQLAATLRYKGACPESVHAHGASQRVPRSRY